MVCPLCQKSFDADTACKGCGVVSNCALIKCPSCGYEFVEKSGIVDLIKKVLEKAKRRFGKQT